MFTRVGGRYFIDYTTVVDSALRWRVWKVTLVISSNQRTLPNTRSRASIGYLKCFCAGKYETKSRKKKEKKKKSIPAQRLPFVAIHSVGKYATHRHLSLHVVYSGEGVFVHELDVPRRVTGRDVVRTQGDGHGLIRRDWRIRSNFAQHVFHTFQLFLFLLLTVVPGKPFGTSQVVVVVVGGKKNQNRDGQYARGVPARELAL